MLHSPNVAALRSAGTTTFSITGGQLNVWTAATTLVQEAGDFEDTPQYKWYKNEFASALVLAGTFTTTATNVATHNMVEGNVPYLPALGNMRLDTARVLSIGDLPSCRTSSWTTAGTSPAGRGRMRT